MCFSSAIALAVVAALASSISATPMNANLQHCEVYAHMITNATPAWQKFPTCYCYVGRISVFIVVQCDRWHWRVNYHSTHPSEIHCENWI
ncbi:hypothetical protein EDD22DRAFT_930398 [Suillus occidentalis]|nr:hypothetical protein EDD22DRAFT_930398 [Suillus occidentalis]